MHCLAFYIAALLALQINSVIITKAASVNFNGFDDLPFMLTGTVYKHASNNRC
jgi:hypothetical protein